MTLIAVGSTDGHPWVIGDVLLTRTRPASTPVRIPSGRAPDVLYASTASYSVAGVRRKLVRTRDGALVLAWTGSLNDAAAVAPRFIEACERNGASEELIRRVAKEAQLDAAKAGRPWDLVLLGAFVDQRTGTPRTFRVDAQRSELEFDGTYAAGSGAKDLSEMALDKRRFGSAPAAFAGLMQGLALAAGLMAREVLHGDNLERRHGGFYEVAAFDGSRFQSPSIAQVFFRAQMANQLATIDDGWFVSADMDGDLAISVHRDGVTEVHLVPGLGRDGAQTETERLTRFGSQTPPKFICASFVFENAAGQPLGSQWHFDSSGEVFALRREGQTLSLEIEWTAIKPSLDRRGRELWFAQSWPAE